MQERAVGRASALSEERSMVLAALAAALLPIAATGGEIRVWSADALNWQESRPGASQRTTLEGDISRGGFRPTPMPLPRVFVLKGTPLLGEGAVADHAKVRRIEAGQVVYVPGDMAHYEGAYGHTVIVGVAEGPWTTRFVDSGGDQSSVGVSLGKARKTQNRAAP